MSLFLGHIHHWLYNKIQWFERIEEEIIQKAQEHDLPTEEWKEQIYNAYGKPTGNKPLEEVIDSSNIHGWLQSKIQSAEIRQAALVTKVLQAEPSYKNSLISIFEKQGAEAATDYGREVHTPEAAFSAMNDFILDGMPCDRVNQTIESNDNEFLWKATTCLHSPYWDKVQGDVQNFYDLRESWIRAFVQALKPTYKYEKLPGGTQKILKA